MTTNTKTAHTPWRLEWVEPGEAWIRDPSGRIVASVSLDDAAQGIAALQRAGASLPSAPMSS